MESAATEITLVHGPPVVVEGEARDVEAAVLAAARGSILELAWLTERDRSAPVALNPRYVVSLRPAPPEAIET